MPEMTEKTDQTQWEAEFCRRYDRHLDELKWLYCELYHNDMEAFAQLTDILYDAYRQRRPSLRRSDRKREGDDSWYRSVGQLGMMMYADHFAKNLKGVKKNLDYIESCGVNLLHLMPLLQSPVGKSDGGYAVSDYTRVDPALGTMKDLQALAGACHRRGINLCLDFVMNHTSDEHEWAKRARAGEQAYMDRYFFYDNWDIPNEYEKTVPQVFSTTAAGNFTWLEDAQKVVMTFFHPYQWDLNYANPVVFNEMMGYLLNLTNQGIDVIRVDAIPYIWKELGTDCRNLPQVHTISRMMRMICEIVCPGVLLLGEVVMEPEKVAPYFGTVEKPECHLLYNATTMCTTWNTVATRDARLLRHQMDVVSRLPRSCVFLNYLRCHDDIGWGLDYHFLRQFGMEEVPHKKFINDYLRGAVDWSNSRGESYNEDPVLMDARLCGTTASLCGVEKGLEMGDLALTALGLQCDWMLHAFMLTQSGVPMLYSGDELAQLNDYSYHDDPDKAEDSRFLHRGNFLWDKANQRGDLDTPEGWLFHNLRVLETVRAQHPVFGCDAQVWTMDVGDQSLLCLVRQLDEELLIALFNFSEEEKTAHLPVSGRWVDLIQGRVGTIDQVRLEGYGFRWFLVQQDSQAYSLPWKEVGTLLP